MKDNAGGARFQGMRSAAHRRLSPVIGRATPLIFLLGVLSCLHADAVVGGRTLIPCLDSGLLPGPPFGYSGPLSETATTCDPGAAFPADYAFDAYANRAVKEGHIPFWNPYQGLGQPFLANGLSALFYPLNWLYHILPPSLWDAACLINMLLAAAFTLLFLRAIGLGREAGLTGAVCVLCSGYFHIWLVVREVPSSAVWWPLMLYGIERIRADGKATARIHVVLAVAVFGTATGGQPEVSFLSLLSACAYALVRLNRRDALRYLLHLLPGPLAGLLLSAPSWVNLARYALQEAFSAHMSGNIVGTEHLPGETIASYALPFLYGPMFQTPIAPAGFRFDTPGWFPAGGLLLVLAAVAGMKRKPRAVTVFMAMLAGLFIAKAWGFPIINSAGGLPLFSRIVFFRYGGFLPAFALSCLAGIAVDDGTLGRLRKKWLWFLVWGAGACTMAVVGLYPIHRTIRAGGLQSDEVRRVLLSSGMDLLWCILVPALILRQVSKRNADDPRLHALVLLGLLLQAVAFQPDGHSAFALWARSAFCLLLFALAAAAMARDFRGTGGRWKYSAGVIVLAVLPQLLILQVSSAGRPHRYNPLTAPPYVATLRTLQQGNVYRSYSLDSCPHPNFSAPIGISSLNNVEALVPYEAVDFIYKCLDRYSQPFWFAGDRQVVSPAAEFWRNKRYFDLVGVRYLTTCGRTDPNVAVYGLVGGWVPWRLERQVEVRILSPVDTLSAVDIAFHAWGRKNPGVLTLGVYLPSGELLASSTVPGEAAEDYVFTTFHFTPITGLRNREISLRLEFQPKSPESTISVLRSDDHPEWGFIFKVVCADPPLKVVYYDPLTSVKIHENPDALPRVFLASSTTQVASWQDSMDRMMEIPDPTSRAFLEEGPEITGEWPPGHPPGRLLAFSLSPNEMRVAYQAGVEGILTVTDSFAPGWHATVNGRDTRVLRVDGVFRGVHLPAPGFYDVRYRYRPPMWGVSLWMAATGAILLCGATLLPGRSGQRTRD